LAKLPENRKSQAAHNTLQGYGQTIKNPVNDWALLGY
jgi:hypothetical protein